ncbi:GNAT family N-acetyltransferase [Kitasatospora sp. NPDC048540]|uniref:GNAT family N-acetyltransferase n=1 Tax=unclassified Kitasatospora TaxID=2633591 RepID=UPI0006907167|nr:GNAT family N-acetyltransferase [Kitasatospora sp. MBT63]
MSLLSLHDRAALSEHFRRDPALHLFELGDLDDLLWPYTSWYTLGDGGPVALLYTVGEIPTLLGFADPAGPAGAASLESLVRAMLPVLPRRFFAHLSGAADRCLAPHYRPEHRQTLLRMVRSDPARTERHPDGPWRPEPLDRGDLADLLALFEAGYPGNWFDERMLDTGQYVGARLDGRLVAVAGVHVYAPDQGVAAIGNVTTHPSVRGRGAAGACVAALCRRLARSVDTIGLNVRTDNTTAVELYRRLGFTAVTEFTESVFSTAAPATPAPDAPAHSSAQR